ncbi:MAG: tRNA (adenosine(37)-N6)-dimethylallyltransferase MiaA [Flavobacteriaceae bacterium]|nr:tRNA (adenosine(37)-N6)-dimethylallyltransferase MiaA [Flavobacteriaceae bacterium]MDZ4148960.1 tRNA (adenosine(37)-N6)-dimethylallyltransferase MiaA [Flavobacteriaceae bacterium]
MKSRYLISIIGPTAIGKTALAIRLATIFDTDIISADSRQFFKEMKIGTAAPTSEEMVAAKHHFIGHKSISDEYSVGHFEEEAIPLINKLFENKNALILVGGSGLYIDAVLFGLDKFPEVDAKYRLQLDALLRENGIEALQKLLQQKDPVYLEKVDRNNPHRLIRALEVCLSSGKPYSSFLNQKKIKRDFQHLIIGLETEREKLYQRINKRVDQMVSDGLEAEAKSQYPNKQLNALQTVGYQEFFDFFDGKISKEEAIESIKQNTRRFAKRQITWFKKYDATWFEGDSENYQAITAFIQHKIS